MKKVSSLKDGQRSTKNEIDYYSNLKSYFEKSLGTTIDKLSNFSKYVPRQDLAIFLAKYEIFKKILNIQGSIIECGVFLGGGLMTFAQLSSILEPVNHQRRIIGFDTFSGFTSMSKQDAHSTSKLAKKGGLNTNSFSDLEKSISLYDSNRFLNHIPKIELVKGDISKTMPLFLKKNPHTIVSLLYLDADVYKPTKTALKNIVPRMPKGAVIAFDELNTDLFVGETLAALDTIGINNIRVERFSFEPSISYAVLD